MVLGWWNATFLDDRECSEAAQSKSEDRDRHTLRCKMIARVCEMLAGVCTIRVRVRAIYTGVCSKMLQNSQNASSIQVKTIPRTNASRIQLQPFRNQPQNPKQLTSESAHPVLHAGTSKRHAARHTPEPHVPPRGS